MFQSLKVPILIEFDKTKGIRNNIEKYWHDSSKKCSLMWPPVPILIPQKFKILEKF